MRAAAILLALVMFGHGAGADEPKPDPAKTYADFSRLIHRMVVKELPKEFEDNSGWGQIVPLTEPVRFPNLPRAKVKIDGKEGYPHGVWRRFKVKIEDPDRDLKIVVREFSKLDLKTFRLVIDSEVAPAGTAEIQNWQKGLPLGKVNAQADALLGLGMVFDIGVTLNTKKFPPELNVEPKLKDLKIDLKEFNLRRVVNPTTNLALEGQAAKTFGDDARDMMNTLIKNFEPEIKRRANEAITQSLKEGKGNISASTLFKAAPQKKVQD
jgi:hypothetical protein